MPIHRSRLLLLLVLASVVLATNTAAARPDVRTVPPTVTSSLSGMKPMANPTSGEPDVGQTPHPVTHPGGLLPAPRGGDEGVPMRKPTSWFGWVFRIWMMRLIGA